MTGQPGDADEGGGGGGGRGRMVVILVVVVLAVAGVVWMAQQMRASSRMQDCLMAGRSNCAPVN